jgi:hypothetical protein
LARSRATPRLGLCLDSLQRLQDGDRLIPFDTVVIDESEQVLAHFLSETMSQDGKKSKEGTRSEGWPQPRRHLTILRALLRRARRVIALDADLDESPKASAFGERVAAGVRARGQISGRALCEWKERRPAVARAARHSSPQIIPFGVSPVRTASGCGEPRMTTRQKE